MTAPLPEGSAEQPLDVDPSVPEEHRSDLPDGSTPSEAAATDQERNAETSFREPSQ